MIIRFCITYSEITYYLTGKISITDIIQILKLLDINYIYNIDNKKYSLAHQNINPLALPHIKFVEITFSVDVWSEFLKIIEKLSLKYQIQHISVKEKTTSKYFPISSILIHYKYCCVKGLYKCPYLIEKILDF